MELEHFTKVNGGWVRNIDWRHEFTPDGLVFTRSTGKMYRHVGRTCSGYPMYTGEDTVQSMETLKYKTMKHHEFEIFKRG